MTTMLRAALACEEWLAFCKSIGWPKSTMPQLCDLWWDYHDNEGTLRDVRTQRASERAAESEEPKHG